MANSTSSGFNTSGLEILESLGQHLRCAEIRLKQGLLEEAAKSFVTAGLPDRAHDCLYRQLLCIAPIGTDLTGEKCDRQVNNHMKKLLDKLDQINLEPDSLQKTQKLVASAYRHALDTVAPKKPIQLDELMTSALSTAEQLLILDLQLQRRLAAQDVSHEEWQAYIQKANQ